MNKLLIVVLVVLALVLLAMPPVLGTVTETQVRNRVEAIEQGGLLSAKVRAYDRGWFHSKAKIELTFAPTYAAQLRATGALPDDPAGALPSTVVAVDLAHGPVAVQDGVSFGWSRMVARPDPEDPDVIAIQEQLGVPYLFEFRGRTGFSGGVSFDAIVPSVDLPIEQAAAQLKFSGAFINGYYKRRALEADAHVESLELAAPIGSFVMRDLQVNLDNELISDYLMPGQAGFTIEQILVVDATAGAQPMFEANQLRVGSKMTINDDATLADMSVDYRLRKVRFADTTVDDAVLALGLRNLDVAAFEAYAAAVRDLTASGNIEDSGTLLAAVAPQIERAFAAGPVLSLDPIGFALDGEPFMGKIEVATNTARLPPAGSASFDNPLLLLGLVDSTAELTVSKPLALRLAKTVVSTQLASSGQMPPDQVEYMAEAQSNLMIGMLAGQGMLVEDGDAYRTAVRFADGALTVNGNPLPFGLP